MNTALEQWIRQATRKLSKESRARVRSEMQDHFESGRETALAQGASQEAADQAALLALGDAAEANCAYRRTLFTSSEARMLKESAWESRMVCSHRTGKWILAILPLAVLLTGMVLLLAGRTGLGQTVLLGSLTLGVVLTVPLLPIYTVRRAQIYRVAKWAVLGAMLWFTLRPSLMQASWMFTITAWPLFWTEWTRVSMRRKLPVARWPKHLYL
jgi:hypothetical protein